MWDHMYNYPFVITCNQIPQEARIYDVECIVDLSDGNSSSAGSRSDTTPKKNLFQEGVRAMSTVLGSFQQQQEIANENIINKLISVFWGGSPK